MTGRPFTVIACDQRSDEWRTARLGRLTGSRAAGAFGTTKAGQWSADRKNLKTELMLERLTNQPQERAVGGYQVRDGVAREPMARFTYECVTGTVVRQCGFVSDNEIPIGCSPDGVVGDFEGLVSIKSPIAATHLATLVVYRQQQKAETPGPASLVVPIEYLHQIRHELYCTGAAWCDYVSYHPAFPPSLQLVIVRIARTDVDLAAYEGLVRDFLSEVDAEYTRVMEMAS